MPSLQGILRSLDLTREAAAEIIGVSKQSVDDWCSGRTQPTLEHFSRMAELFLDSGLSANALQEWIDEGLVQRGMPPGILGPSAGRPGPGLVDGNVLVIGDPGYRPAFQTIATGLNAEMRNTPAVDAVYLNICHSRDLLHSYLNPGVLARSRGAIIVALTLEDSELQKIGGMASERCPMVFVQNGPLELPAHCGFVGVADYEAAKIATELLWSCDYRKIVAVGSASTATFPRAQTDRMQGYQDSIRRLGGVPNVNRALGPSDMSQQVMASDLPALREAVQPLAGDDSIDALLALDSYATMELLRSMHQHQRVPGRDVAVIALGCREWMHYVLAPQLTHVALPFYETGRRAVRMLGELTNQDATGSPAERTVFIPPEAEMIHGADDGTIGAGHLLGVRHGHMSGLS